MVPSLCQPNTSPMLSFRHHRSRVFLAALAFLSLAAALPAYIDQLSEAEVDEAYTLGQRHDQDVSKFFKAYEKLFPNVSPAMHVDRIGIRTPYYSVVLNSFLRGSIYPMSKAWTDYAANPYPFIAVVSVSLPFANPLSVDDLSKPDGQFWKQFSIELIQDRPVPARERKARPLYSMGTDTSTITGTEMLLEYDVRDIASRMIKVQVTGPDRQPVSAEFDLDSLR